MAWIGPAGRMLELKCPAELEVIPTDQRQIFTSLGKRVSITEPGASAPFYRWTLTISAAFPQDIANLRALSIREWGTVPFYWVPPAAEFTNLLSPSASVCTAFSFPQPPGVAQGGPVLTDEGWAGRSWNAGADRYVVLGKAPYVPGHPVTVRAWVDATSPFLRLEAKGSTGATIQSFASPVYPLTEAGWVSHTFTGLPATTASVVVHACDINQATRPSVTWTEGPRSWVDGAAAMSVSIQPVPSTYVRATGAPGQETITNHSFEITEFAS